VQKTKLKPEQTWNSYISSPGRREGVRMGKGAQDSDLVVTLN